MVSKKNRKKQNAMNKLTQNNQQYESRGERLTDNDFKFFKTLHENIKNIPFGEEKGLFYLIMVANT